MGLLLSQTRAQYRAPYLFDLLNPESACKQVQHMEYECLQATLARTIRFRSDETGAGNCRVSGVLVYRVSGVCRSSGEAEAKSSARK